MNRIHILLCTLISLFFFALSANGQERFIVEANSLNVRSGPNTQGLVVHKLHKGDIVEVTQQSNRWSNISHEGHRGWVAKRYLRRLPNQSTASQRPAKVSKPWLDLHDSKVLYWCLLILLIIPLSIVQYLASSGRSNFPYIWLFGVMLLAVWAANVYYFYAVPRSIWFFKDPRWYKVGGNVLLYFGYICYMIGQSVFLLNYIADQDDRKVNITTSSIGIIITCLVIYLLDWLVSLHFDFLNYLIIGFMIYQLYQIFKNLRFGYAILYLLVYTFCFGSLIMIGSYCIAPVLILAFFGLGGADNATGGSSSSSSSSRSDNSFQIQDIHGRTVRLEPRGTNEYYGDDGNWYCQDYTTGEYHIDK